MTYIECGSRALAEERKMWADPPSKEQEEEPDSRSNLPLRQRENAGHADSISSVFEDKITMDRGCLLRDLQPSPLDCLISLVR